MNYQTCRNLQFGPLLKTRCHSIQIDFRDTNAEKKPSLSVGSTSFVLMFRQSSNIHFLAKISYKMIASRQVVRQSLQVLADNVGALSVHLHTLMGELFHSCVNISSQLQNAWIVTCWSLLSQKLHMMLKVEKISRKLQRVWEEKRL